MNHSKIKRYLNLFLIYCLVGGSVTTPRSLAPVSKVFHFYSFFSVIPVHTWSLVWLVSSFLEDSPAASCGILQIMKHCSSAFFQSCLLIWLEIMSFEFLSWFLSTFPFFTWDTSEWMKVKEVLKPLLLATHTGCQPMRIRICFDFTSLSLNLFLKLQMTFSKLMTALCNLPFSVGKALGIP